MKKNVTICWLRRDLRLDDNAALYHALKKHTNVLPLFIFDTTILEQLENKSDRRVQFIHQEITQLAITLKTEYRSGLLCYYGKPLEIWKKVLSEFTVDAVYTNHDFEPYAIQRDKAVQDLLAEQSIPFYTYKDHVVFEKSEVTKDDGLPYTVFTPYSIKWRAKLNDFYARSYPTLKYSFHFLKHESFAIPTLEAMGFSATNFEFPKRMISSSVVSKYTEQRDFPAIEGTSHLGLHLRFGTLSIRTLLRYALSKNQTFVNELIWRDFYQQILWHFPHVVKGAFRKEYDGIQWENNEQHFAAWCQGKTGYPLVDAGMRELNATGFMHNRVRMVVASFLTKHLLIDWRWGEAYFAEHLLDFDLAANNGGWQWAAGCGTDAAPYFRVFNPASQLERFDKDFIYVKKWVPEYGTPDYVLPIVEHAFARNRCLEVYKKALKP
ncbi:MAG: deoxyribodipyrimidine photo-lyase [Chitinophagales bacterium]|nr:deoxyribodipyrimidine photo-lyase [Chitinophagales bacterium]